MIFRAKILLFIGKKAIFAIQLTKRMKITFFLVCLLGLGGSASAQEEQTDTLTIPELMETETVRECEDTCSHIHGIDMSHYQGDVFWKAIGDNRHMAYVYLKATEGGDRIDDRYEENIRMAREHGLKVGSYHFYRPRTEQARQLANFMTQCIPGEQDLIPMIDIESSGGLPSEEFCDSLFRFLEMVEEAYGQKPLLYTFTNFYNKHFCGRLDGYPLMIAQYTERLPVLADDRDITMWQYTSKGHIDGVRGYIDKSRFMGRHSLREIKYLKE